MVARIFLFFLVICLPYRVAATDWLRAETEHYVLHAKLNEDELRDLAQLAEDFGRVLNVVLPPQTRSGRKLRLYLEETDARISRISDWRNIGWVGAWPEFAGSFGVYDPGENPLVRNHTLFYALTGHHVDNGYFRPSPPWVKTGVQLFFATTYVTEEGHFILGAPDIQRPMKGTMDAAKLRMILSAAAAPRTKSAWKRFQGWSREAMFPMLTETRNNGLLESYLDAYGAGSSLEEASESLGDLNDWAKQIRDRQITRRPTFRRVVLDEETPAAITIAPLSDVEVALIDLRFERLRKDRVESAARRILKLTGRYPDSALVWYEYAAAEFARVRDVDLGGTPFRGFGFSNGEIIVSAHSYSDAEAWRAVGRALELQPDYSDAKRLKAEILMSRLVKAGDLDESEFDTVRDLLAPMASNPSVNPYAAALYFQSYVEQGVDPSPAVVDMLGRAFVTNPAVEEFRYAYAVALARQGEKQVAEILLTSMLNHPDYSEAAERALAQ